MKHLIISILFLMPLMASAQLPLEHSFSVRTVYPQMVVFSSNGKKFLSNDTNSSQVKLYNMDYSLWKTINVPLSPNYKFSGAYLISDNLFNADNAVELIAITYWYDQPNSTQHYKMQLISETGSVIQDFGDYNYAFVLKDDNDVYKLCINRVIIPGNGASSFYNSQFYTLPGSMPCDACGNGLGTKQVNNSGSQSFVSAAAPNPTTGNCQVSYWLNKAGFAQIELYSATGQILKSYPISNIEGSISIETSTLPAGIYYYSLKTDTELSAAQQITVVK